MVADAWSRAYEESLASSRVGMAFSNGTSWEMWADGWCWRPCVHEGPFLRDEDPVGCPLLSISIQGRIPGEWSVLPDGDPRGPYSCINFRDEDDDGGPPEPQPQPEPMGMEALFPRPDRAARMLVQAPATGPVRRVETVRVLGGVL